MEIDNSCKKYYVESRKRLGIAANEIYAEMVEAWGETHISRATVYLYYKEFRSDKRDTNTGPTSTRNLDFIEEVKTVIDENAGVTIDEVVQLLGSSHGTIFRVIHEDLGLRSVCLKWIPYTLTIAQKEKRVKLAGELLELLSQENILKRIMFIDEKYFYWRSIGTLRSNRCWVDNVENKVRKAKRSRYEPKSMCIVAVTFNGKFSIDILEKDVTVDSEYYIAFLKRTFHNFSRHKEPLSKNNILFLQDNARPHTSVMTKAYLNKNAIKCVEQPTYSPDFNMLDRFVFRKLTSMRQNIHFESTTHLNNFISSALAGLTEDDWLLEFRKLKDDLNIIYLNGGNFI
jgi:hypothetical protein